MKSRTDQLQHIKENNIDVLVIGGGINGAVSAAVLSAAGIRTALVEARDFAGFTSQNSSNLIWGGIKYLESFEFGYKDPSGASHDGYNAAFRKGWVRVIGTGREINIEFGEKVKPKPLKTAQKMSIGKKYAYVGGS